MTVHRVKRGESLTRVAAEYGISPIKLAAVNGIRTERLIEGEELLILIPTRTANVRHGERLSDLARRFGVKESTLIAINPELWGMGSVYEGQPIAVRYGSPDYGLGIGNGYLYRGATKEQLMRAIPYLSYVTVCSAVARHGGVSDIFDDAEFIELARAAGKPAILRVWAEGEIYAENLMRTLALKASVKGCCGVTLPCSALSLETAKKCAEILHGSGLKMILESDADDIPKHLCAADFSVLFYDKIEKNPIPSFEDGELDSLLRYSERHDPIRCFVDLSPFALTDGKYIPKSIARESILRSGASIEASENGSLVATAKRGGKRREWIMESLSNTVEKLKCISELGFYGISFDIARTPISDLMAFRVMFSESIGMA